MSKKTEKPTIKKDRIKCHRNAKGRLVFEDKEGKHASFVVDTDRDPEQEAQRVSELYETVEKITKGLIGKVLR